MANYCGKCGAKLDVETGKCPNCDKAEIEERKHSATHKNGERTRKGITIAAIILAVLAIACGTVLILVRYDVVEIPFVSSLLEHGEEESTEPTEDEEAETPVKTELLEAGQADITALEEYLNETIVLAETEFDDQSIDVKTVLQWIFDDTLPSLYAYYYGDVPSLRDAPSDENDPLGKFGIIGNDVCKLPADRVDWIVENIFHMQPTHDLEDPGRWYYHDGYYYMQYGGAGYIGHEADIKAYERQADGTYHLICDYYYPEDVGEGTGRELMCTSYIKADLKKLNGKSYWTFYKISEQPFFTLNRKDPSIQTETNISSTSPVTSLPTTTIAASENNSESAVMSGLPDHVDTTGKKISLAAFEDLEFQAGSQAGIHTSQFRG